MNNKKIALSMALALLLTPVSAKAAENAESFKRLSGNNRYATAKAISNYGWTSSNYVIIAQGENFPDALCSVPLAKKYNAPILLTGKDTLTKEAEEELMRLAPSNIIIVGGEGSVSAKVEKYIKDTFKSATLERIGGKDRFETSTKIAEKLNFKGEVALTSSVSFADALSMAPIAAVKEMPILLTPKDKLPTYTSNYLKGKTINKAYIIGGTGVVSENLKNNIANSHRIYGENRFATNIAILKEFSSDLNKGNVFAALGNGPKGNEFADALSGAALAAKMNAPMILTDKTLPKEVKGYVTSDLTKEAKLFALGGEAVVSNTVVNEINSNKGQGNDTTPPEVPIDPEVPVDPEVPGGGGGVPGEVTKLEVKSVYLKADNGTKINGSIEDGKVTVSIPKDFSGQFTQIVVSTSNSIKNAKVAGTPIDEATIKRLYGNDRKNIDLLVYLREQGFDSEGDGLSASSVKMLTGTSITLTDVNGNTASYRLSIN
ncbi:cell wall-binding repeat-containing protein [Clostridium peptidivorans]|uniref:cell wall-binding repeat-containing protein n=1 Tax=Clostridium peptidivorans TaxID=100174 RepID=UPI000BE3B0C9|nr:cell wall-binding repeat-containing protein [Clostridium peptidivorans]